MSYNRPLLIGWSDASAMKEHQLTIIEITTIWRIHEDDIIGWLQLRDIAEANRDIVGVEEFTMQAENSRWIRMVLVARMKFRGCQHEPFPDTWFFSFTMSKSTSLNGTQRI